MAFLSVREQPTLYTTRFRVMGGPASVRFVDDRGAVRATAIARNAEREARRIEHKFSRYRDDSVVSEINRNAGRTPVAADEETVRLAEEALELAERTGGRFDPTSGVLRRVWNFSVGRVPAEREVASLLPLVDFRQVSVRHGTIFLRRPGMELDLGGVGKEYAVDRVASLLAAQGVTSAVVSFAGDVRTVGGRGDGRPWAVGVVDPRVPDRCRLTVRVAWGAWVATSGDYERGFVANGVRYHHLLDATTGWPARGVASATVVASDTSRAGRWATASFLLGPSAGLDLLERTPGIEGVLVLEDGSLLSTEGMPRLSDLPGGMYARYPGI